MALRVLEKPKSKMRSASSSTKICCVRPDEGRGW
jgi:hypothetical protein